MVTQTSPQFEVVSRGYQDDRDYWKIRNFLIETYPITPPALNWELRRWDGHRFHRENLDWQPKIRIWENEENCVVGVVHPEGKGDAFIQIHPAYRYLEHDMLEWGEDNLAPDGKLHTVAFTYDTGRIARLIKRGYERTPHGFVTRRMFLQYRDLPPPEIVEGYTIRTTRSDDCEAMAGLLNAAFERDFHNATEYKNFIANSPSFDHSLNFVVEAPDGSLAAHAGVNYIRENNYGVFEPVCTHPDHRRKGLAQALMLEGLHKLKELSAETVFVDAGDAIAANNLYDSLGFTDVYPGHVWVKTV